MEYIGKIPFAPLMLAALGALISHAVAKTALLAAYLWGKLGGGKTVRTFFRPAPPFGGYLKILADMAVFAATLGLWCAVWRLGRKAGEESMWMQPLAEIWKHGMWTKVWMTAAVVTATGLTVIKVLDLLITLFSLKSYVEDATAEKPQVRRRLLFVTGLEFVLWQTIGWLGKVALFLARYILGAGWARWLVKHALGNLALTPEQFFGKFYEAAEKGTRGEKAKYFFHYVIRFSVVRGLAVAFYGLALW